MLIHFKKNNVINKKIIVTAIWVFSVGIISLLLAVTYQELIAERLTHVDYRVNLKTLVLVGSGILLISGLLLKSKLARWIVLLLAYSSLLTPFLLYVMLQLFMPEYPKVLWTSMSVPTIMMSLSIIYLLSNEISLKIYVIKREKKRRIKEQIYLIFWSLFLVGMYVYYVHIPLLVS